jgi:uncharacterized protein YigE (DUF2233 family)
LILIRPKRPASVAVAKKNSYLIKGGCFHLYRKFSIFWLGKIQNLLACFFAGRTLHYTIFQKVPFVPQIQSFHQQHRGKQYSRLKTLSSRNLFTINTIDSFN